MKILIEKNREKIAEVIYSKELKNPLKILEIEAITEALVEAKIEEIEGWVEDWKNGECQDCKLPNSSVPNWNCKQHAYKDLLKYLDKLK